MSKTQAWAEVDRLGITKLINTQHPTRATVSYIAEHYKKYGLERKGLTDQKDPGTVEIYRHILDDYILPRWKGRVAGELKPLEIEGWLEYLHTDLDLEWTSVAKIKQVMSVTFKEAKRHELIDPHRDPLPLVRCHSSSNYEARIVSADQTLAILCNLELEERVPTILIAATGIRISEALGLTWLDVDYKTNRIFIRRRWRDGRVGPPRRSPRRLRYRCTRY